MTTKTRTLKSNTVPMKFDAYIVDNVGVMGFGLSMSSAEKMARDWNRDARMGHKSYELTARKIEVLVSRSGDKFIAVAVDDQGVGVGCKSWDSRDIGEALLARKMMDVARPVPFAGGWVVEVRFAGNESGDVLFHLETTGLRFYPAADAARMEAANPTLSFGMAGKGRAGALRSCLREAREAWMRNPSYF